jgi:uncharacterized protein YjbI with pentapeptide repeats
MWNRRNVLWWMVLAIILVAVLWFVPQLQGQYFSQGVPAKEVPALVNEYRRTWAQIIGGIGLLLGLYFTWRRVEISQDQQVTERFTRAIDQLGATDADGNPRLEIRLGGIYALERIARDSPQRDYSTVMEVLTAYVRENAPWPPKSAKSPERDFIKPPEGGPVSDSAANEATEPDKYSVQGVEPTSGTPRTDIQAVLDVLNRREEDRVPEKRRVRRLDLHGTDLGGANLQEAPLQKANLQMAALQGANLYKANLQRADLEDANLYGARLVEAKLYKANLQSAKLGGEAYLNGADLQDAILDNAILNGAHLVGTNLQKAALKGADLQQALLDGAKLQQALLGGADLQGANLFGADLQGANLFRADLQGANLSGANLQGADLSEAVNLIQDRINEANGDEMIKLPEGLDRPSAWSKSTDEQPNGDE